MTLADDPRSARLLAYLASLREHTAPWASPESLADAYMNAGSHPDIVARVWDELGAAVPSAQRGLVHGNPALVEASSGVVLALALGTEYALRVPDAALAEAQVAGAKGAIRWSSGQTLEAATTLGPGWVIGSWLADEPRWCQRLVEELAAHTNHP